MRALTAVRDARAQSLGVRVAKIVNLFQEAIRTMIIEHIDYFKII